MVYNKNISEIDRTVTIAMDEAQNAKHLLAGTDHLFLALLQQYFISTTPILLKYESQLDTARTIVRASTIRWHLKKRGLVRLATAKKSLMDARERVIIIAQSMAGSTQDQTALILLQVILEINEANLANLLRGIKIDREALLLEVQTLLQVSVEN